MKKGFVIFYSILISLVFLFALGYFGYNIYIEKITGEERIEKRFKNFSYKVNNIINSETDYNVIKRKITDVVGDVNDFSNISVVLNNQNIYSYPVSIYGSTESNSKLIKDKRITFETEAGLVYIYASLYTLRPVSIYYYGKTAFIIIFIGTIITAILILVSNSLQKESKEKINQEVFNDEVQVRNYEPKVEHTVTPVQNDDIDYYDDSKEIYLPSEEIKPLKIDSNSPEGLFSNRTGFGWRNYLETRLDNELNRATASEVDLSLFIIKIEGIEKNQEQLTRVCKYISTAFQFKDLIFEYKEDTFAAIKIGETIDEALTFAEDLVSEINKITQNNNCQIGISSRAIRLLSAQRLLKEAEEALAHTDLKHDTPIIAFRVDAVKYQKYMEQMN